MGRGADEPSHHALGTLRLQQTKGVAQKRQHTAFAHGDSWQGGKQREAKPRAPSASQAFAGARGVLGCGANRHR